MLPYVPGIERYRVSGAETLMLALAPGDRVTLTDREGGQTCEIVALAQGAGDLLGALGLKAGGRSRGVAVEVGKLDGHRRRIAAKVVPSRSTNPRRRGSGPDARTRLRTAGRG